MSTNAYISYIKESGEVVSSYLHWDGYPSGAGVSLEKHYNTQELVEELVSLGAMSGLEPKIHPVGEHTFENEEKGVCVFYHRDRGDDWEHTEPEIYPNLEEWEKDYSHYNWYYIFKAGEWLCFRDGKYLTIEQAVTLEED